MISSSSKTHLHPDMRGQSISAMESTKSGEVDKQHTSSWSPASVPPGADKGNVAAPQLNLFQTARHNSRTHFIEQGDLGCVSSIVDQLWLVNMNRAVSSSLAEEISSLASSSEPAVGHSKIGTWLRLCTVSEQEADTTMAQTQASLHCCCHTLRDSSGFSVTQGWP